MVLYGDLIVSDTVGFNSNIAPIFLSDDVFCFVAGNSLSFRDVSKYTGTSSPPSARRMDGDDVENLMPECFYAAHPIVALDASAKLQAIAYVERGTFSIKLITYPTMEPFQISVLRLPEQLEAIDIAMIRFSTNSKYLVALTDLPDFQLFVWEVKTGTLLCQSDINEPIEQLSFNPENDRQFCTSSSTEGTLDFWEIEIGHHKFSLRQLSGNSLNRLVPSASGGLQDAHESTLFEVKHHQWLSNNKLMASLADGNLALFDPPSGEARLIKMETPLDAQNMQTSCLLGDHVLFAGRDGTAHLLSIEKGVEVKSLVSFDNQDVTVVVPNVTKNAVLALVGRGKMALLDMKTMKKHQLMESHNGLVTAVGSLPFGNAFVTAGEDGYLRIWDSNSRSQLQRVDTSRKITALAVSRWANLVMVGTESGELLVYDADEEPRLIQQTKLFPSSMQSISFDPTCKYFAAYSASRCVVIFDASETFAPVGIVDVEGKVSGVFWKEATVEQSEGVTTEILYLYVLVNTEDAHSCLYRFEISLGRAEGLFTNKDVSCMLYKADAYLNCLAVADGISGQPEMYTFGDDRTLKVYPLPAPKPGSNIVNLDAPSTNFQDQFHDKHQTGIILSKNLDLLFTYAADGHVTVRSVSEADRFLKIHAHDPYSGGIAHLAMEGDARMLYTVGGDGIIRVWDWSYTPMGKKVANEVTSELEDEVESQSSLIEKLKDRVKAAPTVPLDASIVLQEPFAPLKASTEEMNEADRDAQVVNEADAQFQRVLDGIRTRLVALLEKNNKAPDLEKLNRDSFIIDVAEKERLESQALAKIQKVRNELTKANCNDKVLFERLKSEFWDKMEVIGRSIKSFNPDSLTDVLMEITNYPLRKRAPEELKLVEKVKLRRRIQMSVNQAIKTQLQDSDFSEEAPLAGESALKNKNDTEIGKLLYEPFELTTSERRINQAILLRELTIQTKVEFNTLFQEKARQKHEEITKIEDKNERIREIMKELDLLNEKVFAPVVHDEEAPERTLEVRDSEIKAEKYISPEEQKRIEEARRLEEERLKANQDDSRERALMTMMGGRLEDRTEEQQKEEIIAPDCINKAKSDLTEEEKKLVKEYETKLQTVKEEQEKRRKALEAELRKLQTHVQDLCRNFDQSLKTFMLKKLEAEEKICQYELEIIMFAQLVLFSENDDAKERAILDKLERLKNEKSVCMKEIPEIKNELEIYRDNYEAAVKHDKDIERHCRKEIAAFDFFSEALIKLFRNRDLDMHAVETPGHKSKDDIFVMKEEPKQKKYRALVYAQDAPDGLPLEAWDKMVAFREKKIASEREMERTLADFTELQNLVTVVLENSERIRIETEDVARAMNEFREYKFHATYNPRNLFHLKQGQVEVQQAPVVTDYSDCVLLDRNEVEKLNEVIVNLGTAKVEALTEMKDYRKGIHKLEWENKVLDFQAEDLVIRTRDIQLLRVTKEMQEYLRSGDKHRNNSEIAALERRSEYNNTLYRTKLNEKQSIYQRIANKITERQTENSDLESQVTALEASIAEREKIMDIQLKQRPKHAKSGYMARRKLADLAKSQSQQIASLREEVTKLRLKNYPALPPLPQRHH